MNDANPLTATFLAKRAELRRFFAARGGDADADDLVQETWLRVAALPPDTEVRSPAAYLYRLGNNVMLDRRRQQRARQSRDGSWHAATVTTTASGEDMYDAVPADRILISRDRIERLRRALADLPDTVERAFYRHKVDGLSHTEVAAEMGISRSMVEKHMMRALRHLLAVPE